MLQKRRLSGQSGHHSPRVDADQRVSLLFTSRASQNRKSPNTLCPSEFKRRMTIENFDEILNETKEQDYHKIEMGISDLKKKGPFFKEFMQMHYGDRGNNWRSVSQQILSPYANQMQEMLTQKLKKRANEEQTVEKKIKKLKTKILRPLSNSKEKALTKRVTKEIVKKRSELEYFVEHLKSKEGLEDLISQPLNKKNLEIMMYYFKHKEDMNPIIHQSKKNSDKAFALLPENIKNILGKTRLEKKLFILGQRNKQDKMEESGIVVINNKFEKSWKGRMGKSLEVKRNDDLLEIVTAQENIKLKYIMRGKSCHCQACGGQRYKYIQRRINIYRLNPYPVTKKASPKKSSKGVFMFKKYLGIGAGLGAYSNSPKMFASSRALVNLNPSYVESEQTPKSKQSTPNTGIPKLNQSEISKKKTTPQLNIIQPPKSSQASTKPYNPNERQAVNLKDENALDIEDILDCMPENSPLKQRRCSSVQKRPSSPFKNPAKNASIKALMNMFSEPSKNYMPLFNRNQKKKAFEKQRTIRTPSAPESPLIATKSPLSMIIKPLTLRSPTSKFADAASPTSLLTDNNSNQSKVSRNRGILTKSESTSCFSKLTLFDYNKSKTTKSTTTNAELGGNNTNINRGGKLKLTIEKNEEDCANNLKYIKEHLKRFQPVRLHKSNHHDERTASAAEGRSTLPVVRKGPHMFHPPHKESLMKKWSINTKSPQYPGKQMITRQCSSKEFSMLSTSRNNENTVALSGGNSLRTNNIRTNNIRVHTLKKVSKNYGGFNVEYVQNPQSIPFVSPRRQSIEPGRNYRSPFANYVKFLDPVTSHIINFRTGNLNSMSRLDNFNKTKECPQIKRNSLEQIENAFSSRRTSSIS